MLDKYSIFEYIIPANVPLYKGTPSQDFDMKYNKPSWFTQSREIANKYVKNGGFIHSIRPKNEMRLINVMSPHFHTFLQELVNDLHQYDNGIDSYHKKMQYLIPFGLPDSHAQIKYITEMYRLQPNFTNMVQLLSPFFQHKHRFSEKQLDYDIIELIKQMLWQHGFVGYIAPCEWVSCFHDPFHEEICLFDMSRTNLVYFNYILGPTIAQGGGQWKPHVPYGADKPYDFNKARIKIYNSFGWDGPVEYDENGDVVFWNADYVQALVRKKKYEEEIGEPYPEDVEKYRYVDKSEQVPKTIKTSLTLS